jgi:hypothetical protein
MSQNEVTGDRIKLARVLAVASDLPVVSGLKRAHRLRWLREFAGFRGASLGAQLSSCASTEYLAPFPKQKGGRVNGRPFLD